MIDIVKQIIAFYIENKREPQVKDIIIKDDRLLNEAWAVFVTLYSKWEIRWASWNVREIDASIFHELVKNTIAAISKDERFQPLTKKESLWIIVRVDLIKNRKVLQTWELKDVDPINYWIIVIKKDYWKLAVILPNINPLIMNGSDYPKFLSFKIGEDFVENDYIVYKIKTEIEKDY